MSKLLLDYDFKSEESLLRFISRIWPFVFRFEWKFGRLETESLRIMETGHGWHFYLSFFNKIPDLDVCFLQMALGDDFKRGCFNWRRVRERFLKDWNILYTEKYNADKELISQEKRRDDLESKVRSMIAEWRANIDKREAEAKTEAKLAQSES